MRPARTPLPAMAGLAGAALLSACASTSEHGADACQSAGMPEQVNACIEAFERDLAEDRLDTLERNRHHARRENWVEAQRRARTEGEPQPTPLEPGRPWDDWPPPG